MAPRSGAEEVREGVGLTNLDQPLFEGADATKRDLVDYLDAMSDRIIPVLERRPLSVIRVHRGDEPFMQKNLPRYAPPWIASVTMWAESSKRDVTYALCDDRPTLLWFANQRAVEYHPALMRVDDADHPTHMVLDLDPPAGGDWATTVAATQLVREALHAVGLAGALKTSGAKGLHVFVPLAPGTDGVAAAAATRAIAERAAALDPSIATTAFLKEDRGGRVFVDGTRALGATVVAAYSPRARPGVPVSFPVGWDEVARIDPRAITVRDAVGRLAGGDPWNESMPSPQALPDDLIAEGSDMPIPRVEAMHEGRRRARGRDASRPTGDAGD